MSQGVIFSQQMEGHQSAARMRTHPYGRSFQSSCPVCKCMITPYNSARYCHCDVYAHGGCIAYSVDTNNPSHRQVCEICKAPYNLVFENRPSLRPLTQFTIGRILVLILWGVMVAGICLLLIQLINHSLENQTSIEQLSYFLFATYMALFFMVSLSCFSKTMLKRECTVVGVQPYYRTVIFVEQSEEKDSVNHISQNPLNTTEALTSKQLVEIR